MDKCRELDEAQRLAIDLAILRIEPDALNARVRQAQRALTAGRAEQALAMAREVLRKHRDSAAAVSVETSALFKLNRVNEAKAAVNRGLRSNPTSRELRDIELTILTKLRDHEALSRAFAALRGSAEGAHELAMVYHREAAVQTALGNPAAAIRAYQQAFDVANDPDSLRALAATAKQMGDDGRARRVYQKLCSMNPEDVQACRNGRPLQH
jgi:tetratricopeptide (TPR) repeat protein